MEKIMKDFRIKESWTFLFKEKKWGWKLAIPILLGLALGLIILLLAIPLFIAIAGSAGQTSGKEAIGGVAALILLCMCCVLLIYVIIASIVNPWYLYEYTQVALEDRESNLITNEKTLDVVKKAAKLFLVNFVYNLPISLILTPLYLLLIASLDTGKVSTVYSSFRNTSSFTPLSFVLLCVMFLIILFVVVPYSFFIVNTAQVRLVKTNTFGEAFKFREVLRTVKRNFKTLLLFFGVMFIYVMAYVVVYLVLTILGAIPLIGLCMIPFNIILSFVVMYFTMFVFPYMLGSVYKDIK